MVMRGSVIVPANRHLPLLFAFTLPPDLGSNLDPSFFFEIPTRLMILAVVRLISKSMVNESKK